MARKIWQCPLVLSADVQIIKLPRGSHIMHIGEQDGNIVMWAEVNPAEDLKTYKFRVYGTGQDIHSFETKYDDEYGFHIGTVQMANGSVWHVYDVSNMQ